MAGKTALKPRKMPRQARARLTVAAILEAAAQVFQRHGYAAGTTDRIAERAGVSIGSLYQYFPNKDAILVALAERHIDSAFERLGALLEEAPRGEPDLDGILRHFVEAMIALHIDEPRLHRVLFEEAPLPPALRRKLRDRERALDARVESLLGRLPGVSARDAALMAYLLVRTVESLTHGFILHPPAGIEAEPFVDEVVWMLRSYVAAPRSTGLPA
jgi:AcrR family transcriptional regulator